jgi:CheY-like chemotaxis protein
MAAMGGSLQIDPRHGGHREARLLWPTPGSRVLLVVDDNEGIITLFRRYLGGHNWRVLGATSGAQAHQMIAQTPPTVVILDVMMPDEDGWEVLTTLLAHETTREIPIIVCSVLNESQLALTLGATAYLTKPVTRQSLLQALAPWSRSDAIPATGR